MHSRNRGKSFQTGRSVHRGSRSAGNWRKRPRQKQGDDRFEDDQGCSRVSCDRNPYYGKRPCNRNLVDRAQIRDIEEQSWRRNNHSNDGNNNGNGAGNSQQNSTHNDKREKKNVGFKYVEEIVNLEDAEEILRNLKKDEEGFVKLLNGDLSNDLVVLVVKLALKLCHGSFPNIVKDVMTLIIESKFADTLTLYITNIMHQDQKKRSENKMFWNNIDEFWNNILKLSEKVLEIMPSITSEMIKKILISIKFYLPEIEREHHIKIPADIKTKTESLLDHVNHLRSNFQSAKKLKTNHYIDEDPPDDFRKIPIIPAPSEVIQNFHRVLRPNIVDKPYRSVNQYLDIQFRLLREDFVNPLRKGIITYLDNQHKPRGEQRKLENIRVYSPVQFLNVETVNECCCYRIRYDFRNRKRTFAYENSKRLMNGNLVCFTGDNFQTLLFGKIAKKDPKLLEEGLLIVGFQEEVEVFYETDYIMVESSVYFEPYYQVLKVLTNMKLEEFPMEKYIIKIDSLPKPPTYLKKIEPVVYEIEKYSMEPLHWPVDKRFYNLNDSQLVAFQAALTQEFSIIQGPPGTGKTFLGLKIAHTLLNNSHAWYNHTPMLVICYTNHALDQFLEGLLDVTKNILRVGNRSKNDKLNQFNIRNKKPSASNPAVFQARKAVQNSLRDVKSFSDNLNRIFKNDSIVSFRVFEAVSGIHGFENSWFHTAKPDAIKNWLLEGKTVGRGRMPAPRVPERQVPMDVKGINDDAEEDLEQNDKDEWHDEVFDVPVQAYQSLIDLNELRSKSDTLKEELLKLGKLGRNKPGSLESFLQAEKYGIEIWEIEQDLNYLERKLAENKDRQYRWDAPEYVDLQKPHNMLPDQRWRLYFYWLGIYYRWLRQKYEEESLKFRKLYKKLNEYKEQDDAQVMKSSLVVGMTTSGAARLQSSLQALRSPIVIVEEAAELLEAHIVAALTSHCKHLILIGDHQQLKPSCADYKIKTDYHLGVSLFERMVRNDIRCYTLNVQHRMRPEISSLVKPAIYPNLQDHKSTLERLPILGMQKPIFFLDHQQREDVCIDNSKKNVHEARFIIALARHLILNGYEPEQITILAAYLGQQYDMIRETKKDVNSHLLKDVRIAVLDNYQGEESKIILLSLVRSNAEGKIGFLKIQNRVCVALSRARDGLYIMGNMAMLCEAPSENNIWKQVRSTLENQNAIGPYLPLKCQIHQGQITQVSKAEDFLKIPEGGCDRMCEVQIACGHICTRSCHIQDRTHQHYKCMEPCKKHLCDSDPSHICKKRCFQACGPCTYKVLRTLPKCNHTVKLSCHIDINEYSCVELVSTILPCDHRADKPCSADADTFRCPHPCDVRVEPCGHQCDRKCHIRMDPDHLKYTCKEPCAKQKIGCRQGKNLHICNKFCFQNCEECDVDVKKNRSCGHQHTIACQLNVENIECTRGCKKTMDCGHRCKNLCNEPCGPCNFMVEKVIAECGHRIKQKCHQEALKKDCQSKNCPKILPCGHKCQTECRKPCTTQCKQMVDCSLSSSCGHLIKRINCYLKNTNCPDILLQHCSEPCSTELKCGHECSGTCGECLQGRIHKRCGEKCGVTLVCNHECTYPCREACRPCTRKCQMRCSHSKCSKKCGEPCTDCASPCIRNCPHVTCTKRCSEICDVEPCQMRCLKKLKCGHGCFGFCNDPCPNKCRICDKEEFTQFALGREDEEDAIFVMLNDCGHIFESRDMEYWLNSNNGENGDQQVQLKVCPGCRTNITTTERYSKYAKQAMRDVITVKKIAYGRTTENENFRNQLLGEVVEILSKCPLGLRMACSKIAELSNAIRVRLEPSRDQRRQPINLIELSAINIKLQIVSEIIDCFKGYEVGYTDKNPSAIHLNIILTALLANVEHISKQEKEDIELEVKRLERIIQLEKIENSQPFLNVTNNTDVKTLHGHIRQVLFRKSRYSEFLDNAIKTNLQELNKKTSRGLAITDRERIQIVRALQQVEGIKRGSWFKCPNGHFYVIGECGGAEEIGKCIECNATVGGQQHRVVNDSRFAPEMDDATAPAWPGVHY